MSKSKTCSYCRKLLPICEFESPKTRRCQSCKLIRCCSVCNEEKHIDQFGSPLGRKCTSCLATQRKQCKTNWYTKNKCRIYEKRKTPEGKTKKQKYDRKYYVKNKKTILEKNRNYSNNPEIKQKRNEAERLKNKLDPIRRLNKNVRRGIYTSLIGNKNERHWESLVGYSLSDLKEHLEKQFLNGMNWGNYGEWVIDHIKPIISFKITGIDDEFEKCWDLKNLRPLWAIDNAIKSGMDRKMKL